MITSNFELSKKDKALFNLIIEDLKKEKKDVTLDNIKEHSLFSNIEQKGIFTDMIPISVKINQADTKSFTLIISGTDINLDNALHNSFVTDKVNEFIMNLAGFVRYLDEKKKDPLTDFLLEQLSSSCKKN